MLVNSSEWEQFSTAIGPHLKGVRAMLAIRMRGTGCAEDILQETLIAAWRHRADVQNENTLRAWLFQIARNKCNDYYRKHGAETAYDPETIHAGMNHHGRAADGYASVELRELVDGLPPTVRDAFGLYYQMGYSIKEISGRLEVPEGTVKRRLHDGRKRLMSLLSENENDGKGRDTMELKNHIPDFRPPVSITPSTEPPFQVICPEALWMYESLNTGDTIWFGLYDAPDWRLTSASRTKTMGKAIIHGIDAVEVEFTDWELEKNKYKKASRKVYLADVDGEVKTLAATWEQDGKPCFASYLDPEFDDNWNSGVKRLILDEGRFKVIGDNSYETVDPRLSIGAGRYTVRIGIKEFDCLRVLDAQDGALLEGFLLRSGHVLLGRRYNDRLWKIGENGKYGTQPWDEKFPEHPKIIIDGISYVHWYDTVSDAAFR